MHRLSLHNAQEKSQWLALALSLFFLSTTLALTLLWPPEGRALSRNSQSSLMPVPGSYSNPLNCRECHAQEFQAWSGTSHADASFDPIFQIYLEKEKEPGECFSCHTTGYSSTTGQFVLAGVTCEACHGPYREAHPDGSMAVAASQDLCGTCHTATLAEWKTSHHGKVGVTCADCHEVHAQKTHSAENTNLLCAGCHLDHTQDTTHTIHTHVETGVYCVECHLARPGTDAVEMSREQTATGHSFVVFVSTCSDCHPTPLQPDAETP